MVLASNLYCVLHAAISNFRSFAVIVIVITLFFELVVVIAVVAVAVAVAGDSSTCRKTLLKTN